MALIRMSNYNIFTLSVYHQQMMAKKRTMAQEYINLLQYNSISTFITLFCHCLEENDGQTNLKTVYGLQVVTAWVSTTMQQSILVNAYDTVYVYIAGT